MYTRELTQEAVPLKQGEKCTNEKLEIQVRGKAEEYKLRRHTAKERASVVEYVCKTVERES